jgi:hypothetical protein
MSTMEGATVLPYEEDASDEVAMPQEFYDLFEVVDNGDGTQDNVAHAQLRELRDAGCGPGAFD